MSISDIYEIWIDVLPYLYFSVLMGIFYFSSAGMNASYEKHLLENLQAAEEFLSHFRLKGKSTKADREFADKYFMGAVERSASAQIAYETGIPLWFFLAKMLFFIIISYASLGFLGIPLD